VLTLLWKRPCNLLSALAKQKRGGSEEERKKKDGLLSSGERATVRDGHTTSGKRKDEALALGKEERERKKERDPYPISRNRMGKRAASAHALRPARGSAARGERKRSNNTLLFFHIEILGGGIR